MITETILDSLRSNTLDVTTIAGILFSVFLIIYFFVAIKPGLDSGIRVNRQVQRRLERDRVNEKYQKTMIKQQLGKSAKAGDVERVYKQQQAAKIVKKPYRKNNGYYSKDKGYQAYLKRNTLKTAKKLTSTHNSFKKVASFSRSNPSTIKLSPQQSFNKKADSFLPISISTAAEQRYWENQIRKANGIKNA